MLKAKSLTQVQKQAFAGLDFSRKPISKNLDKYDICIVGANLGALLSRHFDQVAHGHYTIMSIFDQNINQCSSMRNIYEQQRATKTDFFINAKLGLNMYTAHSELVGVEKFLPQDNALVLRNGRKINYNFLVCAMGLKQNLGAIKGFEEAWKDTEHPVYTNIDHLSWRSSVNKHMRMHYTHTYGDAYFCIPQYPFQGEVENYNFFLSKQIYEWYEAHGKMSPLNSFTVINANDRFVQYLDSADTFIKDLLKKRKINVEYGLNLIEVKKSTQEMVLQNVKTGLLQTRPYNALYSLIPCEPHESLIQSGLAHKNSNNLLDVDIQTLQHKQYKNIFGLGDVCNLPTSKTFWGGFHQVHVVRDNLYNFIQNKPMNALYTGYSKVPLLLGQCTTTYVVHYYDQQEAWHNLLGKQGGPLSLLNWIRYCYWAKNQKKKFLQFYLFKTYGPPTFKFYRRFSKLSDSQKSALKEREKVYDQLYPNRLTYHHEDPHHAHHKEGAH